MTGDPQTLEHGREHAPVKCDHASQVARGTIRVTRCKRSRESAVHPDRQLNNAAVIEFSFQKCISIGHLRGTADRHRSPRKPRCRSKLKKSRVIINIETGIRQSLPRMLNRLEAPSEARMA